MFRSMVALVVGPSRTERLDPRGGTLVLGDDDAKEGRCSWLAGSGGQPFERGWHDVLRSFKTASDLLEGEIFFNTADDIIVTTLTDFNGDYPFGADKGVQPDTSDLIILTSAESIVGSTLVTDW